MFPFAETADDAELTHDDWVVSPTRPRRGLRYGAGALGAAATLTALTAASPADAMPAACACGGGSPSTTTPDTPPATSTPTPKPPVSKTPSAPPTGGPPPAPVTIKPDPKPAPAPTPVRDPGTATNNDPAPRDRPLATKPDPKPAPTPSPSPQPAPEPPRAAKPTPARDPGTSTNNDPAPRTAPPAPPAPTTQRNGAWMDQYIDSLTKPQPKPDPKPTVTVPQGTDTDLAGLLMPGYDVKTEPAPAPAAKPQTATKPRTPKPQTPKAQTPAVGTQPSTPPTTSNGKWFDTYVSSLTKPAPAPKPQPRPEVPKGMTPYKFDQAITGPIAGPLYTPGQQAGAKQRLDQPVGDLQARIDELNDLYGDDNFIGPKTPQQQQQLNQIQTELTQRQTQLTLYSGGYCDYRCDVDAPYVKDGGMDDPLDAAADELPAGATRSQVLAKAQEMAAEADKKAREKPKDDGISPGHTALDIGGLAGPVGPIFDGANAIWYAAEGDWGNAGFSAFGAIPVVGDVAKGGKLLKTGVKVAEDVNKVDNAVDATRALVKTDPTKLADDFATKNLNGKFDTSDGSGDALAGMFGKTSSGTRASAVRAGEFLPSQTRGYATEMRTLTELAGRSDVKSIKAIPSGPGGRTPDFVVTKADGSLERVEVTTVTGAGTGYKPRGIGSADAPSKAQIKSAIRRKTLPSSQFNSQLDGVGDGGTLVIGLRGGKDAGAEARNAVSDMTRQLSDAKVREVTFTLPGGQTQRYVLEHGAYVAR